MKRLLCILFVLMLLTGCNRNAPETTAPAPTTTIPTIPETTVPPTEPTEPSLPWIEEVGRPWDAEGSLVELPITVPNGLVYASCLAFDGDLLLWSQDDHRIGQPCAELCVVDLDSGGVHAQADIPVSVSIWPQVLGDSLFLHDGNTGLILQLDKQLNVVKQWQTEICDAAVYMDANGTAYVLNWNEGACAIDLETGEQRPILEENAAISHIAMKNGYLQVAYYHTDTGEMCLAFIDLYTGQRQDLPLRGLSDGQYQDGTWLSHKFDDSYIYTVITADGEALRADVGYSSIRLLEKDLLLMINEGSNRLSLHDLSGKSIAECVTSEREYGYISYELIPSDTFGGYFVVQNNIDRGIRVLYWDPAKSQPGEDIPFAPIPEPTEMEAQVQSRVEELEREYALSILVGQEIDTYFMSFTVEPVTDWAEVMDALDTLEDALEDYPEGFFQQLRYGDVHRTEIHLAGNLMPTNAEYPGSYVAFVEEGYDCHVMVVDILTADVSTYYHEFSHIIDSFLEWDAMQREDALFSEEGWSSLNPSWFPGYTNSYAWSQDVLDYTCFVDSYSTINPTEDRARVLEYAMVNYDYNCFENAATLTRKLEYYCQCIRDAFDTTGWPDTVLWEQYLP